MLDIISIVTSHIDIETQQENNMVYKHIDKEHDREATVIEATDTQNIAIDESEYFEVKE